MVSYKKFMDEVVGSETMTKKQANFLLVRLAVLDILVTLTLTVFTASLVGTILAILMLVGGMVTFLFMLDYAIDTEESFSLVNKISKLWFLGIPLFVGVVIFLHYVLGVI